MKICTVLGARPQFIKAGSISREIINRADNNLKVDEVIIHTGQHYDSNMSDIFFEEMHIPKPQYFLNIGGGNHGAMTGEMIKSIEAVLEKEKPDYVLVYGDTNSTLAGAIAASKLHIDIAHVESGLRSFNMKMPEEINRILTDRISKFLFCPTDRAKKNLDYEGFPYQGTNSIIIQSGDVMLDGALYYRDLAVVPKSLTYSDKFVLATIHRAENTNDVNRLKEIIKALRAISEMRQVILPLHPRTKTIIRNHNINIGNIDIIEPVGYLNMVWLIKESEVIITDSGGLQKEAYFFGKPAVTMRDETEWTELVDCGVNRLTGANSEAIITAFNEFVTGKDYLFEGRLYGNGNASKVIVDSLLKS